MKYSGFAILFIVACIAPPLPATQTVDTDYVATLMYDAYTRRHPYPDVLRINPSLTEIELQNVQTAFVKKLLDNGRQIGGFKGGFIPSAALGGVLFSDGLLRNITNLDRNDWQTLLIEAEVAFEFCEDVLAPIENTESLRRKICRLYPAIELPDAALPDLAKLRGDLPTLRRLLIPTNMAFHRLLLGAPRDSKLVELNTLNVTVKLGEKTIGERSEANKSEDLWAKVLWVVNEFALVNNYSIKAGQIVIPGALTGLHPGAPGAYEIDYDVLGTVRFEVQ